MYLSGNGSKFADILCPIHMWWAHLFYYQEGTSSKWIYMYTLRVYPKIMRFTYGNELPVTVRFVCISGFA